MPIIECFSVFSFVDRSTRSVVQHFQIRIMSCTVIVARCSSVVRAFAHGAMGGWINPSWSGPIELFLVPASASQWYNKVRGMCNPVCGIVHIKEPLLLIGKSSPCGFSGFPLSLSEWSFTICLTPYNRN